MTNTPRQTFTAAQAKAHFADSLRSAEEGGVVVITRYGKPVAALVQFSELETLDRLRAQTPADGLAGLFGMWDDSEEYAEQLDKLERTSRPGPRLE